MTLLQSQLDAVHAAMPFRVTGTVQGVTGLAIEASDLALPVGSLCRIHSFGGRTTLAEVISFKHDRTILTALSPAQNVLRGDRIENIASAPRIWCSEELLGRVLDGYGNPIDGGPPLKLCQSRRIDGRGATAMSRKNIDQPLTTSLRAIDGLHTCGMGQRMGIFSGPGVGKSTLISSIARNTSADISVVALIGERSREVQDFLTKSLTPESRERCIVIVSTSDDPPLLRIRAARVACTVCEYFRDQGKNVLLLLDSLTRLAHAQRQVGVAAHEPPTTKGYPPSVFALLPEILERAGRTESGSITGFYTVLVEGDDFNEPIPDAVKGISDGHIWLNRALANRGHYPAIDVLQSISRVRGDVADPEHLKAARRVLALLAVYQDIEDMVNIGAYVPKVNLEFDLAVQCRLRIVQYLQQTSVEAYSLEQSRRQLLELAAYIDQMERTLRTPTKR